jgi:energy-coupling factor transport system permease protein
LLKPLAVLKVPVGDIAMIVTIAIRFIPLTAEEAEKVKYALAARGMQFDRGGALARLRAMQPVLVPLVVGLFRRADALALAMESRSYQGTCRTRPKPLPFPARQLGIAILASLVLVILGVVL